LAAQISLATASLPGKVAPTAKLAEGQTHPWFLLPQNLTFYNSSALKLWRVRWWSEAEQTLIAYHESCVDTIGGSQHYLWKLLLKLQWIIQLSWAYNKASVIDFSLIFILELLLYGNQFF
jgi:hypothetical protein